MLARTHLVFGATCFASFAALLHTTIHPVSLAIATGAALLPDLDHPQSLLGRRLWFISKPLSKLVGHRGVTHSLIAVMISMWALFNAGANTMLVGPLVIGYLSHILGDLLTKSGVPLFWPWKQKITVPLLWRTGSGAESVLRWLCYAWLGWLLWEDWSPGLGVFGLSA